MSRIHARSGVQAASSLVDLSFTPQPPKLNREDPQLVGALQEYRASLQVEADNPTMEVRLGSLNLLLGDLNAARDAYSMALKLDPGQADAYVGLALVDVEAGDVDEALRNARSATKLSDNEKYRKFLERVKLKKP